MMEKPDWQSIADVTERRRVRKEYAAWRMASDLPNHVRRSRPLPVIIRRIPGPERVIYRDNPDLQEKLAAMEAAQAKLKEKPETPEQGPPEDFLQHRNEGESLEAFRQRMRQWRSSLHSQMMGAKEGVGVFSDEDRRWLAYLEGIDWLGR